MKKTFKILSIDGGGIRGIYPAYVLMRLQEDLKTDDLRKFFDMFIGTSTGSIVATALSYGISPDELFRLYYEDGHSMFKKNPNNLLGLGITGSMFVKDNLDKTLTSYFKNDKLTSLNENTVVTATSVKDGKATIFRSYSTFSTITIKEAVLSSISAPYYFDFETIGNTILADGGLWANNPSIVGFIEAKHRFKVPEENIKVLSLGTGFDDSISYIDAERLKINEIVDFISLLLHLQTNHLDALSKIMMQDNLLKVNFEYSPLKIDTFDEGFLLKMEQSYEIDKNKIIDFIKA